MEFRLGGLGAMRSAGSQSQRISSASATHRAGQPAQKPRERRRAARALKAIHTQVKGEYGRPRMWKELLPRGVCVGKERVRKLLAPSGIRARHKRRHFATTNSNHVLPVAPNLLARNFTAAAPNRSGRATLPIWDSRSLGAPRGHHRPLQPAGSWLVDATSLDNG